MTTFLSELKRRNVLRVTALYLVSAWLIAQIADVIIGLAELPPSVGRTILIILALGFPVALGLSWAFEWTPEGIRRDSDAEPATAGAPVYGRRMDVVIIALLSVAVVYFAATHDWRGPARPVEASIAVLPFDNRSAQDDDTFFTDGVHDDLLTQLAKISSLVVISRTSVMQYRDSAKTIPQIAAELGVATILEGGVQRAGNRVRINLQLIDAMTDRHLWAETYDRELSAENVFAIQSEIATTIAATLRATLLPGEQQRIDAIPTHSLDAYDAYLLGRRDVATRDYDALLDAVKHFEEAIRLDPGFALAWSGLAEAQVLASLWGADDADARLAAAERAARRALELNPQLGEAHTAFGVVQRFLGVPPEDYVRYLQRGVELAPGSADARKWYADYLSDVGRQQESFEQLQRAAELDPMSPIVRVNLANALESLGRLDEARAAIRKALEIDPTFLPALFSVEHDTGDMAEGLASVSSRFRAGARDPWMLIDIVLTYLMLGDDLRAEQWSQQILEVAPDSVPMEIARLNIALFRSRWHDVRVFAGDLLPKENIGMPVPSRLLLHDDLRNGDPQSARTRYAGKYPALLDDDPEVGEAYTAAIDVALLLQALGEEAKATVLLERSLAYLEGLPRRELDDIALHRARALALLGRREAALTALEAAVDSGWRFHWYFFLPLDAAFDSIRDDPRFRDLVQTVRDDMAAQLERVREREANGDIVLPAGGEP